MKKILILAILVSIISPLFSQRTMNNNNNDGEESRAERNKEFSERKFVDRLAYGGDLSLQFGTYTYINLSPIIGYRLNPDLMMGFGLSYQYLSYRWGNGPNQVNRTNIYGGRGFIRHELGRMFFMHGEYEILNLEAYSQVNATIGRLNVDMAGLGIGYKSMFGDYSYYYIMVLYDFIANYNSPYPTSPIIFKAGFIFGK